MRKTGWILLALMLAVGGAAAARAQEEDTIVQVAAEDAEMNAAKARAIASLPGFYSRVAAPRRGDSRFMIKFDILPGDEAEFVWASELERSGGAMTGVLINQPVYTDDKLGDRVPIAEADIIDWGYFSGEVLQGSYTNRVLIKRLPAEQAEELRRAYGW
jgi:uncharacterized protein YegJ (DUF2314 family)